MTVEFEGELVDIDIINRDKKSTNLTVGETLMCILFLHLSFEKNFKFFLQTGTLSFSLDLFVTFNTKKKKSFFYFGLCIESNLFITIYLHKLLRRLEVFFCILGKLYD